MSDTPIARSAPSSDSGLSRFLRTVARDAMRRPMHATSLRGAVGDDTLRLLVSLSVLVPAGLADYLPCDSLFKEGECPMLIAWRPTPTFPLGLAECGRLPRRCESRVVTEEHALLYRFSLPSFLGALRSALAVPDIDEVDWDRDGRLRVGRRMEAGVARDVLLVAHAAPSLHLVLDRLREGTRRRTLVLVLSSDGAPATLYENVVPGSDVQLIFLDRSLASSRDGRSLRVLGYGEDDERPFARLHTDGRSTVLTRAAYDRLLNEADTFDLFVNLAPDANTACTGHVRRASAEAEKLTLGPIDQAIMSTLMKAPGLIRRHDVAAFRGMSSDTARQRAKRLQRRVGERWLEVATVHGVPHIGLKLTPDRAFALITQLESEDR